MSEGENRPFSALFDVHLSSSALTVGEVSPPYVARRRMVGPEWVVMSANGRQAVSEWATRGRALREAERLSRLAGWLPE